VASESPFFHAGEIYAMRMTATRECTYKYLSRGIVDACNQPTSQPASQSTNQPTNEPTNQPTNQPTLLILPRGGRAWHIFFSLPLVWNQLYNGFKMKEKSFLFRSAVAGAVA